MKEKFTQGELIACESYADNGVLSHYNFVDENGDIIGFFCDEDALIKKRLDREKSYAILFSSAPEMYSVLKEWVDYKTDGGFDALFELEILKSMKKVLKKARGEK